MSDKCKRKCPVCQEDNSEKTNGRGGFLKKLSICIPTYNRDKTLGMALESVIQQAKGLEEIVEICVSNNCSKDTTEQIVEEYSKLYPINYHKMKTNVGHLPNWDYMVREQATGEFIMLLGDDDIIINDGVRKMLAAIDSTTSDYIYLNHCYKSINEMRDIVKNEGNYETYKEECECYEFTSRKVDKWEEILNFTGRNKENNMIYIGSHLFKKEVWKPFEFHPMFEEEDNPEELSEATLPFYFQGFCGHSHIIAKNMMGRSCYYLGEPIIVQSLSTQDPKSTFPIAYLSTISLHMQKLEEYGMDSNEFADYKKFVNGHVLKRFANLMINRQEVVEKYPLVKKYIIKNIEEKDFIEEMFKVFSDSSNNHAIKIAMGIMNQQIEKVFKDNKNTGKIILWGTGDVAKSLINASEVMRKNIDIVVDSNILHQGKTYEKLDKVIESPEELKNIKIAVVIISSIKYELDIIEYLKKNLNQKIIIIGASGITKI